MLGNSPDCARKRVSMDLQYHRVQYETLRQKVA